MSSTAYQLTDDDIIRDLNTLEEDDTLGTCGSYHHCYLAELLCRKYPEIEWVKVSGQQINLYAEQGDDPLILTPTELQLKVIGAFDDAGRIHSLVSRRDFMEHLQEEDRDLYRQLFPSSIYSLDK